MQVDKRYWEKEPKKGWYRAIILVIAWLLIISLARDVWQINKGFNRIYEADRRLTTEEAKNAALKNKMRLVLTKDYQEKLIREKLNMQKEGEILIVMPERRSVQDGTVDEDVTLIPNWGKWWKLVAL